MKPFLPAPATVAGDVSAKDATVADLYWEIWRGSLPAIAADDSVDRDLFYGSYFQTYLQRDVRDLAQVGDELAFHRFVRASAARTGQMLNLSDLARDADIAPNTAKTWLSILRSSGIVHLMEPWHGSVAKRLVKTPKLYFLDTGLAAYLTEWSTPQTLEAGAMAGPMFETWVVGEVLRSYVHNGLAAPLYYFRDRERREIDLLILRDGVIHPVEIKKSANPQPQDGRHFKALAAMGAKIGAGAVICLVTRPVPLTSGITAVPASMVG